MRTVKCPQAHSSRMEHEAVQTVTAADTASAGRVIAAVTHLGGLVTWIVGPLVVLWLSDDPFVRANALHALNWQLTVGVVTYVALALYGVTLLTGDTRPVLWSSVIAVCVLGGTILFCVVATLRAATGDVWEYPLSLRIVETSTVSRAF